MQSMYEIDKTSLKVILDDILHRGKNTHDEMVRRIEEGDISEEAKANYGGAIVGLVKLYMDYKAILEEISGGPSGPAAKEIDNLLSDVLIEMHLGGYNRNVDQSNNGGDDGPDEPSGTEEDMDEGGT